MSGKIAFAAPAWFSNDQIGELSESVPSVLDRAPRLGPVLILIDIIAAETSHRHRFKLILNSTFHCVFLNSLVSLTFIIVGQWWQSANVKIIQSMPFCIHAANWKELKVYNFKFWSTLNGITRINITVVSTHITYRICYLCMYIKKKIINNLKFTHWQSFLFLFIHFTRFKFNDPYFHFCSVGDIDDKKRQIIINKCRAMKM